MKAHRLFGLFLIMTIACYTLMAQDNSSGEVEAILQADRDFARVTADKGLEGWMSFIAHDAVKLSSTGALLKGHGQIRQHDAATMFADPAVTLHWTPTEGGIFEDQQYGYTRGRYELRKKEGDQFVLVGKGTYLTVWRKGEEGKWWVVTDSGLPDQ